MKRSFTRFTLLLSALVVAMCDMSLTYAQTTGPAGVSSGIVMWLDASNVNNTSPATNPANAGSVSTWKDISGNGNNASILSGQGTPKISSSQINGHDVVTFTRASAALGTVYEVSNVDIRATNMPKLTIFTVYRQGTRGASDEQGIWGDDDGGWDRFFMTAFASVNGIVSVGPPTNNVVITNAAGSGTKLLTTVYDNGAANGSTVYFNAVPVQSVTDNTHLTNAKSSLSIGWDGDNNPFDGDIAEMILYNRKLSDCEIKTVNRYLSQKYGVPFTTASISPSGNGYFCTGGSVTLTGASSVSGATFSWLRNGSLITGATGSTYSATQAGSYRVIATVGGCPDTSVATVVKVVPPVIYVNGGVTASGDGASWGGALKTINEALDLVNNSACNTEIWVKAGTYYPTTASGAATTSRDSSFRLTRNGIGIYGGFAGTETARTQRNPKTNLTVLSGDIGVLNDSTDNVYNVVMISAIATTPAVTTPSVLDGFTIRDGNGNDGFPATSINLKNEAGGVLIRSWSGPTTYADVSNCVLTHNFGVYGGGLCAWSLYGGGKTVVNVSNSVLTGNRATFGGGAMAVAYPGGANGITSFINCVFTGNTGNGSSISLDADGAASVLSTTVSNCTFYNEPGSPFDNYSASGGTSSLTVNNSIVWKSGGNYAPITLSSPATFNNSNLAYPAAGTNINANPMFVNASDPDGTDNIWGTADDGLRLSFASPSVNAGLNSLVPASTPTDFTGAARIQTGVVDQGAYEGANLVCPGVSRLYVNSGIALSGTGGTWGTALKTVWEALTIANGCPGVNEIWVRAGTYYPMVNMLTQATSRDSSFRIVRNGIKIYGGFTGTETQLSSRNVIANPTILSGDINTPSSNADNSWHVMTIVGGVNGNIDTTTRVDGFTMTQGNANSNVGMDVFGVYSVNADGGGVALIGSNAGNNCSPYIANCTFSNNNANVGGGAYCGAYLGGASSPYFADCIFRNNSANDAGAIHAYTGVVGGGTLNPRFYRTKFLNNAASGGGGAMGLNNGGLSTNFVYTESCVFSGNTAGGNGGAYNTYSGDANLTAVNSVFADNTANNGGAIRTGSGTTTIINSTFSNNSAASGIGNTINTGGTANITNSIIWGAGATQVQNGAVTYNYSDVRGITPTANSFNLDPLFVNAADADGADDIWGTADDGLLLQKCSPAIDKGSNTLVPTDITLDVAGAARVQQTVVDMGAYESVMSSSYTWMTGATGSNPTTCSGTDGSITIATAVTGRVYTLNYSRNGTPQSPVTLTGTAAGVVVLTGQSAGSYSGFTLTYNGCTSAAFAGTVILSDPAAPVISSVTKVDPTTCGGTNGSMTINGLTASTAYSISYLYNGNTVTINPAMTNGSGSYLISGLSAGVYSSITATRFNCSGSYFNSVILNAPATPVVTASSNAPICSGTNLTLFANTIAGATYSWTGPNGYTSTQQNPVIASAQVGASGTYQVIATAANCASVPKTVSVVVNQMPENVLASSNGPLCEGATIQLNGSTTTSGVSYSWTGPGGFTSTQQNPAIVSATVANSGTYTFKVTDASASCSYTILAYVTVNPVPVISSTAKSDPTTCGGSNGSITLNGLTNGTSYTINYSKGGTPQTAVVQTATGGAVTIGGLTAGSYSGFSAAAGSCTSTAVAGPIVLNPPAAPATPVLSSNGPICSGAALNLSTAAVTGASYAWTGPNSFSSTAQNPSIASATVAAAGSYQLTVTVANCPSLPGTLNVVVNQTPAGVTAGSNSPVCSGNTINLTGASTTSGVTYAWSGPNGYASGVQSPSISGSTVAMSGTYTLTVSNAGATCTATATAAVVVRPTPAIAGASGTGPLTCGGTSGTISITGLTASTAYTATFLKGTTSQTGSGTTDASGVLTLTGLGQGSYSNFVVTLNGCASAAFAGPVTLSDPPIPVAPTASSNSPVCQGGTVNLSVTGLAGATFSWTGPSSFSSTSATPTVTNLTSAKAGNYNVTQTIAGCVSPAATAAVVMTPLPAQPGTITGPASPCLGSTNTYGIASVTNATSYVWTIPSTWTSTGSGLSISAVTGTGAGTISVVAVNGCGSSTARTLSVTVNTIPAQPAAITGPVAICNGVSSNYSIAAVSNTSSYTWVLPTGWSGSSTTNTISATPDASSGTIYVFPNNVCGSGNSQSINVAVTSIPAQPGVITGSVAPCIGSTQQYYIAPVSGASSYAWTYPAGGTPPWSGPATGTSVNAAVGAVSGNISVTATNGCGTSPARNLQINTVPVPSAAGVISGNAAPCIGATEIYRIAAVANATSYSWSFPGSWSGVSTSNQISLVAGAGSGTITVTPIGVCGNGTPATLNVSGTPIVTPSVSLARSTATDTICAGSSVTFTATPVNGGTTPLYTFRRNGNVVASGGASTYTTSSLSSGDRISVTMSSSLPCVSLSQVRDSIRMIVLPVRTPGININTQPPTAICAGTTIALNTNDTNGGSNPTYQWYLNGGQITGATMPQYTPPVISDGDTFQVVMTSSIACPKFTVAPSNKIGFRVLPIVTPSVSISSNPAGPVPRGTEVTFTATPSNGGPNPLFQWYRNGVEVSGATGPVWMSSSLSSGDQITVRMISDAACPAPELVISNVIRMNVGSTGVAQVAGSFDGNVRLYPNPNTGRFTVEASNVRIQPGTRCGIDVLNALGQTVYHMVFQPDRATWSHDVSLNEGIANGAYMLRIYAESGGASGIPFVLNR